MPNPVVHFEVVSKDREAIQKFYSALFDWKLDTNYPDSYGMVDAGDEGIAGGIGGTVDGAPGHATFYVQVKNLQESLDRAESLGGKTVMPPLEIPDMVKMALFTDPDGNVIGLVEER
ncbi:MAG: VOC family protein [Anaerolineales bacterium]|nr:VOC family protein [Anaerolineales bacterium]